VPNLNELGFVVFSLGFAHCIIKGKLVLCLWEFLCCLMWFKCVDEQVYF
jgi:hypothetical protein